MAVHMGKYVAYYRVSTREQGDEGHSIDAQQKIVRNHLNGGEWELIAEFTEVESGRMRNRPELEAALELCQAEGATLVSAKLDRLTRNVRFLCEGQGCGLGAFPGGQLGFAGPGFGGAGGLSCGSHDSMTSVCVPAASSTRPMVLGGRLHGSAKRSITGVAIPSTRTRTPCWHHAPDVSHAASSRYRQCAPASFAPGSFSPTPSWGGRRRASRGPQPRGEQRSAL